MKIKFDVNKQFLLVSILVLIIPIIEINYVRPSAIIDPSLAVGFNNFAMVESSISNGFVENIKIFDFSLPELSWKINEIELNFTNVEFIPETITLEDQPTNNEIIDKFHDGYGVQIAINDPTIIYGVYIYGNNESSEDLPISVRINGFNELTNSPNNTVFGTPAILNMSYSTTPTWHLQTFPDPIYLHEGDYYLVMDGAIIGNSPKSLYHWFLNDVNPSNPGLYQSSLNSGSWSAGAQGTPFLYKLIQKVNISFFPEEINMTAKLDENLYKVSNGNNQGQGYLKKSNVNYNPNKKDLNIEVKNNKTSSLKFSLEYKIDLENDFLFPGSVFINYNNISINQWSLFPNITRKSNNYSLMFTYPKSWENIKVYRNSQDITLNITLDALENRIIIANNSIEDNALWEFKAESPVLPIAISALKKEFRIGQELRFSIGAPILSGNYTLVLYDPLNLVKYETIKQIPFESNIFSYLIPSNAEEGNYLAIIFWNNATDAGMTTQVFSIINAALPPAGFDFSIFIVIGIVAIGGSGIGFTGYSIIKKVESNKRDKLRILLEKCNDIMNLEYVIVLDMKSGIDVYSQSFGKKELDSTLISGFLQAIHNFGVEVIEGANESRTVKVEYQKSIVIMTDFINVRLITIMKSHPSENFLYSIESLAYDIYKDFGKLLEEFEGGLKPFQGIRKLVEKNYNVKFLYPLKVVLPKSLKLNQEERDIIKRAIDYMRENDTEYFYSLYLLPENACTPKDYKLILNLIERGAFQPIESDFIN